MNKEQPFKNLNEFIEKVDQMKKQDKMDLLYKLTQCRQHGK